MSNGFFEDRLDAGRKLAIALDEYRGIDAIVLGMARGGVVVGFAVAQSLGLPLQALVVRKLGAPDNPELALGAVSETGVRWIDDELVRATNASERYIQQEVMIQFAEARRRQQEYHVLPGLEKLRGRPVIVVDDGIATGASALVAVQSVRDLGAATIILATPTAAPQSARLLSPLVDRLIALVTPDPFLSVGLHYDRFTQTTDREVVYYLREARRSAAEH